MVIPFDKPYVYDFDGPHDFTADQLMRTWGHYDEAMLRRAYGIGFEMLPIMSRNKAVHQIIETFNKKSDFDMLRLWGRNALTFECHEKKEEEKVPRK